MSTIDRETVINALRFVIDPTSGLDMVSLDAVDSVELLGADVAVSISLGYPAAGVQAGLVAAVEKELAALPGIGKCAARVVWNILSKPTTEKSPAIAGVKNIIAVASGKGGVGKSTTAVNLALALSVEGARVGILDADIYGPSQPTMLGVGQQRPEIVDQKFMRPVEALGLKSISMGYLVTDQTPMVWRGPMASSALQQLVNQCQWGELDYLVVDMPPGTGDIQLTLSQSVPLAGAVIVTTPQDIALLDAKKGIEMFTKVNVPILGVVENMATHVCSSCGHEEPIFGTGGGASIAKEYGAELLGALPLDLSIRELADSGTPSVEADPESDISKIYREIAKKAGMQLWQLQKTAAAAPEIIVSND